MKVVTAAEMRQIDMDTIESIGIPGIVLMETAGSKIVRSIERHYPDAQRIGIFVGKGNNGGDGLVIARQLAHAGREVYIFLVSFAETFTGKALTNLDIVQNLGGHLEEILTDTAFAEALGYDPSKEKGSALKVSHSRIASCELLVDAIFGTGLRGTVREPIANIINSINNLPIPILSVDLPSGLDAGTGHPLGTSVQADIGR